MKLSVGSVKTNRNNRNKCQSTSQIQRNSWSVSENKQEILILRLGFKKPYSVHMPKHVLDCFVKQKSYSSHMPNHFSHCGEFQKQLVLWLGSLLFTKKKRINWVYLKQLFGSHPSITTLGKKNPYYKNTCSKQGIQEWCPNFMKCSNVYLPLFKNENHSQITSVHPRANLADTFIVDFDAELSVSFVQ